MKENSLFPDLIVISLKFRDITMNFREICRLYNYNKLKIHAYVKIEA